MNRFVATDLEGTLSSGEMWRGIGAYLKMHGRAREHQLFLASHFIPALLARAALLDKQKFRNQWLADQVKLLRGATAGEWNTLAAWVVENELWPKRRGNVITELERHHGAGCTVLIATGAHEPIAYGFARRMQLDNVLVTATPLEFVGDHFSGNFAAEMGVGALKAQRVRALIGNGQLVAAYGDTAADAAMLEMSAEPVAVAPDAALAKIAAEKGWRVL